ncbi:hypothetical protein CEXT_318241 [Caerostris extrusa]|uniref:Uncharacterized protein n=1 Tax=Caerostris extrusa TaxID=172846 RepID=A0AAV4MX11_CAEEX|nr:hypothetical protein CEXT_318241 [Caerostris extrusa]
MRDPLIVRDKCLLLLFSSPLWEDGALNLSSRTPTVDSGMKSGGFYFAIYWVFRHRKNPSGVVCSFFPEARHYSVEQAGDSKTPLFKMAPGDFHKSATTTQQLACASLAASNLHFDWKKAIAAASKSRMDAIC